MRSRVVDVSAYHSKCERERRVSLYLFLLSDTSPRLNLLERGIQAMLVYIGVEVEKSRSVSRKGNRNIVRSIRYLVQCSTVYMQHTHGYAQVRNHTLYSEYQYYKRGRQCLATFEAWRRKCLVRTAVQLRRRPLG